MRTYAPAVPRDARFYVRLGVIVSFATAGALFLASSAPESLAWITARLSRRTVGQGSSDINPEDFEGLAQLLPMALLGAMLGAFVGNVVYTFVERLVDRWDRMHTGDKVTLVLGFFAGLVVEIPFLLIFQTLRIDPRYTILGMLGLTLGFGALGIYTLQSMADVLPWNRGRGPGRRSGIKILDTNVIIDGRIYDVVRSGFLDGQLYVPGFVLDELQHIADSHDALRRQRGRRGLDVLRHMQADFQLEVRSLDKYAPDSGEEVDARLVRLAKHLGADIVTNDFNLNRVAGLQDVRVLSLNDLALALRSNVMPQETLTLGLVKEGNQPGQGVGYLEDGTMVVVENGKSHLGETVDVKVSQVIQTERGKMVFAELDEGDPLDPGPTRRKAKRH